MTTPSHVMIEHGLVDLDHVSLRQLVGCWFKWEFISNMTNWTNYHDNSLDVFAKIMLEINSLRCSSPIFFDMFLEKTRLEYDSSNDADWVRDLRCILIAAHKNYVLDAPLGDRPIAGADTDVMNV